MFLFILTMAVLIGLLIYVAILGSSYPTCSSFFIIGDIAAMIGCIYLFIRKRNRNKQKEEDEEYLATLISDYKKKQNSINMPRTVKTIKYIESSENCPIVLGESGNHAYIWKSKNTIFLFPSVPTKENLYSRSYIQLNAISIDKIEYFGSRGEIYRENKITGGDGGGSSLGGAVIGGMIAGDAGAIIGSRKGIKEIKSELITHDERVTFLNFFNENKERCTLIFDFATFEIFNDLIPEKEYSIVKSIKNIKIIKQKSSTNENSNIPEQLRELAKLKNEGILTEQEFLEKKKILLEKIN